MSEIDVHVRAIQEGMARLADIFATNPKMEDFNNNVESIVKLEQAFNLKSVIDVGITKAAMDAEAGRLVGSSNPIDFLTKRLGLSRREAYTRISLVNQYFGKPEPQPEPKPKPQSEHNETPTPETEQERHERERLQKEDLNRREQLRKEALENALKAQLSARKMDIIHQEMRSLGDGTTPNREQLLMEATSEAKDRSPEDLRAWVRKQVKDANKANVDPFAAIKRRAFTIGSTDTDGGANINGYLPGEGIALLKTLLAPARKPDEPEHSRGNDTIEADVVKDKRTIVQRRADALLTILKRASSNDLVNRGGVGTIVVSLSAKDIDNLEEAGPAARYPTNTGVSLTPFEIARLGAAQFDFGCVLDTESGRPLYLGRTARSASLSQRIALVASELVCSHPGCDRPLVDSDIHHIRSWFSGGPTDIENLTMLCYKDHPNNDDDRSGFSNKGYADHDPRTGRVGFRSPWSNEVRLNESVAQQESAGAKTRKQPWADPDPPPDDALF